MENLIFVARGPWHWEENQWCLWVTSAGVQVDGGVPSTAAISTTVRWQWWRETRLLSSIIKQGSAQEV